MNGISALRIVLVNLFFLALVALLVAILVSSCQRPAARTGALLIDPEGVIVDELEPIDPVAALLADERFGSVELETILRAIRKGKTDDNVKGIVLRLDRIGGLSTAHAARIGTALADFRSSGKSVQAYGDYFDQPHFLLASHADAVYLHPEGQVWLPGFGVFQQYLRGLLDKLHVSTHVFRVGTYKSFVEPYTRNDMSEEAKAANQEIVDNLWRQVRETIALNRGLDPDVVNAYSESFPQRLQAARGEMARTALEAGLIDELLTRDQMRARFADLFGSNDQGDFDAIDFRGYALETPRLTSAPAIAVLTAQGPIMMNDPRSGVITPEKLVPAIRSARQDEDIRALVLRINSSGGSAFASELIREELELVQLAGKPVVVSMSSVAASGAYWIAATADRIVAEPATVTGSIGIFGIIARFNESLSEIGVQSDGVRSGPLGGALNPTLPMNEQFSEVLQSSIESGYQKFVNLVARGRGLTPEQVDRVAQGRVWTGERAKSLNLVDALGGLDSAITLAAELAELSDYDTRHLRSPESFRDALLRELLPSSGAGTNPIGPLRDQLSQILRFDDPQYRYLICPACDSLGGPIPAWR